MVGPGWPVAVPRAMTRCWVCTSVAALAVVMAVAVGEYDARLVEWWNSSQFTCAGAAAAFAATGAPRPPHKSATEPASAIPALRHRDRAEPGPFLRISTTS